MRKPQMESAWSTWLIFGDSKVGKTTLAATAPKPLILNRDNGTSSLLYDPSFDQVRIEDIRHTDDLESSWDNLAGIGTKNWSTKKTVVLDDLPSIQLMVMDEFMEIAVEKGQGKRMLDDPSKREFGLLGNRMRRYIRKFKDLPMHKIFVCGQMFDEELEKFKPSLVGQMRNQIAHFCDGVGYLKVSKKTDARYLYLRPRGNIFADTRFRWLPARIKNPNMTDILEMIAAGPTEALTPIVS